jgi:Flp pilus assembly protein TadD
MDWRTAVSPGRAGAAGVNRAWWWLAAVLVVTTVVYLPAVRYGYVNFDDGLYVSENPHVRAGLTAGGAAWALRSFESSNWHPLTWLSLMLDTTLFGDGPFGHHLVNLVLHLANTLLLAGMLARMTGRAAPPVVVAGLFALHPLHVESVAWVSERKDVLSTLLWFAAIAAYLYHLRRPSRGRYAAVLAIFALGLAAKPMLVTLPAVLLLLDFWPLGRFGRGSDPGAGTGRLLLEKTPLIVLSIASSAVTFVAQRRGGSVSGFRDLPFAQRMTNALVSYVDYLRLTVAPRGLAILYPHRGAGLPAWRIVLALLLLAVVGIVVVRCARSRPWFAVGWFWYLGTLLPVIGLVQVGMQAMADRYTYVPLVGIFVAAAWGLDAAWDSPVARRLLLVGWVSAGIALALLSARQVTYWKDGVALFSRALAVADGNALAHNNLAVALLGRGDDAGAARHYRLALGYDPENAVAHYNLGVIAERSGKWDEALGHYRAAVSLDPKQVRGLNNLGIALARAGDLAGAETRLRQALGLDARHSEARYNLGFTLQRMGRLTEAAAEYRLSLEIDPDNADALDNLATILMSTGKPAEAAEALGRVVRLRPGSAAALNNLGIALAQAGRLAEARRAFGEAVRLDPADAGARTNLERAEGLLAGGAR